MESARLAVDGALDAEPCAPAEVGAARNLMAQAEAALADRDYARARQLADAARLQADRARQVAIENAEDCNRVRDITESIVEVREDRNAGEPVVTNYEFSPIYFGFDSATLDDAARRTLNAHAEQLARNPSWRTQIEGHCDAVGSTEYNLALGEQRARAVRDYLTRMGVSADRLSVVSYGAEMPVSTEYSRNRRAEFRVRR
ncbi:MAG: OmpA family protein [Myxococcales bacterium]|nr:OmpA family protein [Myxococcales bacterium]MCB9532760.1 OmpA family protein [Myxococcales bacterium]